MTREQLSGGNGGVGGNNTGGGVPTVTNSFLSDPITPLEVAVVDSDLLRRVEIMNAASPLYADDFATVQAVTDRLHPGDRTVVVLGPGLSPQSPEQLIALRAAHPGVAVVAVASDVVPTEGMSGVDRVLDRDCTIDDLVEETRRVVADRCEPAAPEEDRTATDLTMLAEPTETRLVLVTSAKGGVGRSTVALNLATALAVGHSGQRVALVETDPVYGDIGIMLGLPGPSVDDDVMVVDEDVVRELCTFRVESVGLDVVLPPRSHDPWFTVGHDQVRVLLGAPALDHEWLVVDISPTLLCGSDLLEMADRVYLVSPTDVAGLKNASILQAALRDQLARRDLVELVLVDRVEQDRATGPVAKATGAPVAAVVPHDRRVALDAELHRPIVDRRPHLAASRVFRKLAERTFKTLGAPVS
ncbi:MAG: P-loop NTPase [Acidimicrobiia bacterium]|nr:P-loop NTPase [Acidimicrobiia bacterium]